MPASIRANTAPTNKSLNVLHKGKPLANVEVTCFASSLPRDGKLYVDEKNQADVDRSLLR